MIPSFTPSAPSVPASAPPPSSLPAADPPGVIRRHLTAGTAPTQPLQTARNRLLIVIGMIALVYSMVAVRMTHISLFSSKFDRQPHLAADSGAQIRREIQDRNGVILAMTVPVYSLSIAPKKVIDPQKTARKIVSVLKNLTYEDVLAKLNSSSNVVFLARDITPQNVQDLYALGITGIETNDKDKKRIYPLGALTAHAVGYVDTDGKGQTGLERSLDAELRQPGLTGPVQMALDVRVQAALREEMQKSVQEFQALGAAGVIVDLRTAELLAMVSLPDYDPGDTHAFKSMDVYKNTVFNRVVQGVYEMGSTYKLFNTAAALEARTASPNSSYDASHSIQISRYEITDYHPENRWLTVPEILIYSSNIGSARMAMELGTDRQRHYLTQFGQTTAAPLELREVATPLVPDSWREINTMTIAFGHGISVTPLNVVYGVSGLVNNGQMRPLTLLRRDPAQLPPATQIVRPEVSKALVKMMRLVVSEGTASKADVVGYEVAGKTGTAEKSSSGGYNTSSLLSSFIATFPASAPRYLVLVMIDEPHGTKETAGFATAGWTAAPAVGRVVARIAPLLGILPDPTQQPVAPHKGHGKTDPSVVTTIMPGPVIRHDNIVLNGPSGNKTASRTEPRKAAAPTKAGTGASNADAE